MKKYTTSEKKELAKLAKEKDIYLNRAIKFIMDFGKYKERKKYVISDVEYINSIKEIQNNMLSISHNFNILLRIIKAHKLEPEHKQLLADVNEIILEELNAEMADAKNKKIPSLELVKKQCINELEDGER